jgi:DNA polymerase III epsilon subunit-like protein
MERRVPSLLDPLRNIPLCFVDVETTGASCAFGHRVIEIGIVRVEHGGKLVTEYSQLVDPQRRIGAGVVALTGITQEMVSGQPLFSDIRSRVVELMQGAVVVGHDVRFDLSFLAGEFRRCRATSLFDVERSTLDVRSSACEETSNVQRRTSNVEVTLMGCLGAKVHVLDTVRIARRRFGRGGNGLQRLAPRLGVEPTAAHRALADAVTTFGVFEKLMESVGGWDICLCDAIAQQGGPMGLLPASPSESLLPLELTEALEAKSTVMMEYVDVNESRTQRVISPQQVRRFKGELILVAHCHLRNDRRNFKLDRIVRLTKTEEEPTTKTRSHEEVPASPLALRAFVSSWQILFNRGPDRSATTSRRTCSSPSGNPPARHAAASRRGHLKSRC